MSRIYINNTDYTGRSRSSRNLHGILDHARRANGVDVVTINATPTGGGAVVDFEFHDGAYAKVNFASFEVANLFVKARRSWGLELVTGGPFKSVFVRPGCKIREGA